jgi:multidrug efflux pump subunit AcrA (membrane-fusion protein)
MRRETENNRYEGRNRLQTERDIAISDAPQGGRNGQTRQPTVKKKIRFPVGLAVPVGAAVAGLIVWHFLGNAKAPALLAPVPPAITVQTLTPKKTRIWNNFSGRLKAVDAADIRPEVSGQITEVRFQDGQMVKAGDILFVIEPSPYEAAVARAEATIASDKANLQFAALDQSRNDLLLKTRVIAQRDYDQTNTKKDAATAALLGAQAELKKALVDLDHAYSGTIRARAKFDNKDQTLVPGMFVSVRLASSHEQNLLLVSDRAIGFDQSKEFVFIVTSDKKVRYREVDLGTELGGQRVVLKGLDAGDRVIVDGVQHVHPGDTVDPKELDLAVQDAETGAPIQAVKDDSQ